MRTLLLLCVPAVLLAQSASTTYQTDVNGRRSAVVSQDKGKDGDFTSRIRSVNGRDVPVEESTDKVLRKDASGSVTQRTVQRYDANGRVANTERVLIEEKLLPNGGKLVTETTSSADLNGRFQTLQRMTTETQVSGDRTTTNVTLDRPALNGGFATEEKRQTVAVGSVAKPGDKQQATETVDRLDPSGRFRTVERRETTSQLSGTQKTENTETFSLDHSGRMALKEQKVATTTTLAGGGSTTETTVFRINTGANAQSAELLPDVQQVVNRTVGPDGRVTESLSVRRADAANPGRLGPERQVSETVCTGKCLPPTAAATDAATAAATAKAKN